MDELKEGNGLDIIYFVIQVYKMIKNKTQQQTVPEVPLLSLSLKTISSIHMQPFSHCQRQLLRMWLLFKKIKVLLNKCTNSNLLRMQQTLMQSRYIQLSSSLHQSNGSQSCFDLILPSPQPEESSLQLTLNFVFDIINIKNPLSLQHTFICVHTNRLGHGG